MTKPRRTDDSDTETIRRAARNLPFFVKALVFVVGLLIIGQIIAFAFVGAQQSKFSTQQNVLAGQQQVVAEQQKALRREVRRVDALNSQNAALNKALAQEAIERTTQTCEALNSIKDAITAYIRGLATGGNTAVVPTSILAPFPEVKRFIDESRAASRSFNARALLSAIEQFKHVDCAHPPAPTTTTTPPTAGG